MLGIHLAWTKQSSRSGVILDGVDNLRYNWFRRCWHVQWLNDQWHACSREPSDAFASRNGFQDDCGVEGRPGGTGGEKPGVCHPSSIGLHVPYGT